MNTKATRFRHPKEMYFLAITEMCQRFAFWGIANLLVIYLVQFQNLTDKAADQLFGLFTGVAFIFPLLGGYIADRFNYRLPVLWGIGATGIGCLFMATGNLLCTYIALTLVAIGAGVFTPSIYTLLGMVYKNHQGVREGGFSIYYSAVNVGTFIAMLSLGWLGQANLWNFAFFIAGCIQLVGLFFFRLSMKNPTLNRLPLHLSSSTKKNIPLHKHEKHRIAVICVLSLFSIFFWIAYNQGGSSLNLFALRYTDRMLGNLQMPATWLLSSETLYLILFAVPLASLYAFLAKKKKDPTPPMKSALSLVAMGICFLIMAFGARQIPPGAQSAAISPFYLITAYAFMAIGEMLIAPIGLALITHISPHRFTGLLVGLWYLCIGLAFYLGGAIAPLMAELSSFSSFFNIFVLGSLLGAGLLFVFVKKLNRMRHLDTL